MRRKWSKCVSIIVIVMTISMVAPGILSTLQDQKEMALSKSSGNQIINEKTDLMPYKNIGNGKNPGNDNCSSPAALNSTEKADKDKNASDTNHGTERNKTDDNATGPYQDRDGDNNQSASDDQNDTDLSSNSSDSNGQITADPYRRPIGPQYYNLVICTAPDISLKPVSPTAYKSFEVHFKVQNTGSGYLSSVTFDNYVYIDGIHKASVSFSGSLSSGAKSGDLYVTIAAGLSAGSHTIKIFTDATNKVTELAAGAESDNTRTITITIGAQPLPDLKVSGISLKDCDGKIIKFDTSYNAFLVTSGQPITIIIEIQNVGSASASGAFNTYLWVDNSKMQSFSKTDLKVNEKVSFSYSYYPFHYSLNSPNSFSVPYSTHSISTEVDTGKAILESNEGNNLMTSSIKIVKAEWTIFLYMSAGYAGGSNSDLSSTVECELGVLSLVGSDSKMSIVAMAGKTGKPTMIYFITKDAKYEIPRDNFNLSWSYSTEINMGSYWNLICFGNYAMRQFEASHYIVSLCDHGGGPRGGLVWGVLDSSEHMYPNQVHTALSQFYNLNMQINSKKIDLVIVECCMMSSIEMAYEIKDYADFMSAPELTGQSINNGVVLHYDNFLGWLKDNYNDPYVTKNLCTQIVDTYIKTFPKTFLGQLAGYTVQWGAIDLSKIGSLASNLDSLVNSLISGLPGYGSKITDMFNNTWNFYGKRLFDIQDLMEQIKANFDSPTIKQLAQNVENALSSVVVYSRYFIPHVYLDHYANANGLSIFFQYMDNDPATWKAPCIDFYDATNWDEFILAVYDQACPEQCTISAIPPSGWSSTFSFSWSAVDPWPLYEPGSLFLPIPSGIAWYGWNIDNGIETWTKSTTLVVPSPALPLTTGIHTLSVRAKDYANNIGYYGSIQFALDTTPPSNPNSYASTPPSNVWSNDNTIYIAWSGASDGLSGSGIFGYSYVWDHSSSTIPDTIVDTTGTSTVSSALSSGTWYFHTRAMDNVCNWASGAYTVGPFKIDVTAPTAPGTPTFSAADVLDGVFTLSWSLSTDTLSGVSRYELQQMASGGSWVTVDGNIAGNLNSYTVSVSPGTYCFRMRAVDLAGNWGPYSSTSAPAIVPGHWFGMTIDDGHYFNFYSFQDPSHGTAYHIDTIGSSDWAYQFMGTYTEKFVVKSDGTIDVSGWFRFSDLGFQPPEYPPEGRRLVYLYLIVINPVSNTIEETVLVLDYTDPVDTWIWVDNLVVSGLTPGSTINIGIGRSDAWEIDWKLTAEWAGVVVTDANGLHIT